MRVSCLVARAPHAIVSPFLRPRLLCSLRACGNVSTMTAEVLPADGLEVRLWP